MRKYDYVRTVDKNYWKMFLGRNLTDEEYYLLEAVLDEKKFNKKIIELNDIAKSVGLFIPKLTNMNGNCLFECLQYFGIVEDIKTFRKYIASFMLEFKNYKYVIRDSGMTLLEQFQLFQICASEKDNEKHKDNINYVICKKQHKLFAYNYDIMCRDLATNKSWTRLPTNLIMVVISFLFNVKFIIHQQMGNFTEVMAGNLLSPLPCQIINLGLIGQLHYVPLDIIRGTSRESLIPKYQSSLINFHKWACEMCIIFDKFTDVEDNDNIKDKKIIYHSAPQDSSTNTFVNF